MDGVLDEQSVRAAADMLANSGQAQTSQLRKLADAALAINSTLSLDGIQQLITDQSLAIVGAHQAATSITDAENWAQAFITVDLSDKYANWRSYNQPSDGSGIYAVICRENQPLRLTQAELETHPA